MTGWSSTDGVFVTVWPLPEGVLVAAWSSTDGILLTAWSSTDGVLLSVGAATVRIGVFNESLPWEDGASPSEDAETSDVWDEPDSTGCVDRRQARLTGNPSHQHSGVFGSPRDSRRGAMVTLDRRAGRRRFLMSPDPSGLPCGGYRSMAENAPRSRACPWRFVRLLTDAGLPRRFVRRIHERMLES